MLRRLDRDRLAIIASLLAPPAVAAVLVPLRTHVSSTDIALILVVVIVAVSALGNRLAGAIAALSAAVWFDFFITRPYERFSISKSADIRTAVLLLLVGLAVSQLAARARRLRVVAITDAHYLGQLHEAAVIAQRPGSADLMVDHVAGQLVELLQLRGCRFEYGKLTGHPPRLAQDGTVMIGSRAVDVEKHGMPQQEIELRVFGNGRYYGRYMMTPNPDATPELQARLVAVTLAEQVGSVLDMAGTVPRE